MRPKLAADQSWPPPIDFLAFFLETLFICSRYHDVRAPNPIKRQVLDSFKSPYTAKMSLNGVIERELISLLIGNGRNNGDSLSKRSVHGRADGVRITNGMNDTFSSRIVF